MKSGPLLIGPRDRILFGGDSIRGTWEFIAKRTTYLQHVEVNPHEWRRIWAELAPQAKGKRAKKR